MLIDNKHNSILLIEYKPIEVLFTKLQRIIVACDILRSSSKLKRDILPPLRYSTSLDNIIILT